MHLEAEPLREMAQMLLLKTLPPKLNPKFIDFSGRKTAEVLGQRANLDDAISRVAVCISVQIVQVKPVPIALEKSPV